MRVDPLLPGSGSTPRPDTSFFADFNCTFNCFCTYSSRRRYCRGERFGIDPYSSTLGSVHIAFTDHAGNALAKSCCRLYHRGAFALSGTVMQGITCNPLADAGLLGINAGACFAVTLCTAFLPTLSYNGLMGAAFLGATVAALIVYGFGAKKKKADPIRLILAGSAVSSFLTALSQGMSLAFGLSKDLSFYTAGSLSGILWPQVKAVTPWLLIAVIIGLLLAPKLSILALGDESASGLGVNVGLVRAFGLFAVLLLAGASVSLVGGISFVGIIIPHVARKLVGADYRRLAPAAALMGAVLLILSDVAARMLQAPFDTPTGALVSVIGVPIFLLLTYRNGGTKL